MRLTTTCLVFSVVLTGVTVADDLSADDLLADERRGESYVESFGGLDLEMVWIPGESFQMGSRLSPDEVARRYGGEADAFRNEHPLHAVTLDGFWIGKFEVTNRQFRRFKPKHDSGAHEKFTLNDDEQPVVHVTWEEASAFCEWLSQGAGRRYRLPSEAQWEYACRGGTKSVRYWGDEDADIGRYANALDQTAESVFGPALRGRKDNVTGRDPFIAMRDGFEVAAPVGSLKPNAYGLHDTIGNAIEYCRDWYDPDYYQRSPAKNPVNLTPGEFRVSRGGSWLHPSFRQRAALRGKVPMSHRSARVGFRVCRVPSQEAVREATDSAPAHPSGGELELRWTLVENSRDARSHRARWAITNRGRVALPAKGWTIYFNMLHLVDRDPILEIPPGVRITHFNGDLFKLQPTAAFEPLPAGETFAFEYRGANPVNKHSWGPQGPYIVFEDEQGNEETPSVIGRMIIDPLTRPEQISRGEQDLTPVPTPAYLHRENQKLTLLPPERVGKVTPTPVVYHERGAELTLDAGWSIAHERELKGDAEYLTRMLKGVFGTAPHVEIGAEPGKKRIVLRVGTITVNGEPKEAGSEAYTLTADPQRGIEIVGADADGVFYGIQTLLQLLPPRAFAGNTPESAIPAVHIEDEPRFAYRGQHIDVSHNFHSQNSILRLLDRMAFYKLNRFHFQVSDDEGWRIEIPELPELTEIGGGRAHTRDHDGVLHPSYGAGPFREPATFGTGFYTRDEFIEILRHARALHIDVIPEINMPAHARAAIIAMKAREKRLMAQGKPEAALEYRLHDPHDTSRYISAQGFLDNAVCVVEEPVYHFAETIIRNFEEMFAEAGMPLEVWHFGADEVPAGVWTESPLCQKFLAEHPELDDAADLKNYFVRRMLDILKRRELQAACWQEAALDHVVVDGEPRDNPVPEFAGGELIPYVWNNLRGNEDLSARFANMGYPVVLCCVSNLYFDLAYNKDPLEPGLTWGGFIDARKPFEFVPEDVFKSTRVDAFGQPYDRQQLYRERESLTAEGLRNILGVQGQIWCETIKSPAMLDYSVYPKQIGLAERGWAARPAWAKIDDLAAHDAAAQEAWNEFANRLGQRELPRLDSIFGGTRYRLPPPGAVIENGTLHASSEYPGLIIRYTTDGSDPTATSAEYTGPVAVSGIVKLATFDTNGRASRTTTVE